MKIVIVRHAIAMHREEFALHNSDDDQRPLTAEGVEKMKKTAKGLKNLVPEVDGFFTSPLLRAKQTAQILSDHCWNADIEETAALRPDMPSAAFADFLKQQDESLVIAAVGHEPHLSQTMGYLLTGQEHSFIRFRKGGACLLEWDPFQSPGTAKLRWALIPSQLRKLK